MKWALVMIWAVNGEISGRIIQIYDYQSYCVNITPKYLPMACVEINVKEINNAH